MTRDRGGVRYHRGGWEIRVSLDGQKITRRVKGQDTRAGRKAAEEVLDRLLATSGSGALGLTVAQLLERYKAARWQAWAPSTRATYPYLAAAINEALGSTPLEQLRAHDIERVHDEWRGAKAAAGTIKRRHTLLAAALAKAERWGLIAVSPARAMEPVSVPRNRHDDLPLLRDVEPKVARIKHRQLRAVAQLALDTGARRGELVALRWRDVEDRQARITAAISAGQRKGTKAENFRTIALDDVAVRRLEGWRKTVTEASLALGHRITRASPIFPCPTDPASPWMPEQVTLYWGRHRAEVGLDDVRFHDLRHVHASTLLDAGVPVPVVAERLGHTPATLLNVYGHAVPSSDSAAAAALAKARKPRPTTRRAV